MLQNRCPLKTRAQKLIKKPAMRDLLTAGVVRQMGLEPIRQRHTPLKRACLPVPALPHMLFFYQR